MFNFIKKNKLDFAGLSRRAEDIIESLPPVKKRRRLHRTKQFFKYLAWTSLALAVILLVLFSSQLLSVKQIFSQAASGRTNLEQALLAVKNDDFKSAAVAAAAAESNFSLALLNLENLKDNLWAKYWPLASDQLNQAGDLMMAAQFLSKAAANGAAFGQNLEAALYGDKKLNFSQFSAEEKRKVLQKIYEAAPELNGIKADLDLAAFSLNQVGGGGIFILFKNKINEAKIQLNEARRVLAEAVPLSQLLPALAGYPGQANFLVLLQNSDELRPTGGFLGTYGIMQTKDGEITNFQTHDIYHLDMPIQNKLKITPPEPIKKYLNASWYLRDANWSPDWPTAARQIDWFYRTEAGLNGEVKAEEKNLRFNGIIAITPKLITDWLKLTGPITVENQTYDQDNFTDLLEYRVEKGYVQLGVSKWQRKEVIGAIARQLKIKLLDLPPARWPSLITNWLENLADKNVQFYLTDQQLENLAVENGWGGEIKQTAGDYLYVVDANLAALKTDAVMKRGFEYALNQRDGGLYARLNLNYAHSGLSDWKTGTYKSYTRIYVPAGSRLIKISGYDKNEIAVGNEAGKTWFGFYLTVNPGQIANLTVEYRLPDEILNSKNYSLWLQKQPGKDFSLARVDLNFLNGIKSYSPASLYVKKSGPSGLSWEGDFKADKTFSINF